MSKNIEDLINEFPIERIERIEEKFQILKKEVEEQDHKDKND